VVEFVQQVAVIFERRADQPGEGKDEVPVGHDSADLVGDESGLDEGAALVTGRAEAALLAGEGEEVLVAAVGAMKAGEAGVDVAAFEERLDGGGGVGRKTGHRGGVIVEDLPDWRGAGLARAVSKADHPGSGSG